LNTVVLTKMEQLRSIEADWRLLIESMEHAEIFDGWEWNRLYLQRIEGEGVSLFVVVVYEGRQCIGIAPLCLTHKRVGFMRANLLQPIDPGNKDYCSFYLHKDYNQTLILKRMIQQIVIHQSSWDYMELRNFNSKNKMTFSVQQLLSEAMDTYVEHYEITPYVNYSLLPQTQTQSSRLKSIERKERKLLKEHKVQFKINQTFNREVWERFVEIHRKNWQQSILGKPEYLAFYEELFETLGLQGQLECSYVEIDGCIAAVHMGFNTPHKTYYYIPAFDYAYAETGAGLILLKRMLEHYRLAGKEEFDFLRGEEAYKFYWADRAGMNFNMYAFHPTRKKRILKAFVLLKINARKSEALLRAYKWCMKRLPLIKGYRGRRV
jgi:hypothetical protein